MFEQEIGIIIIVLLVGILIGVILTLVMNKIRSGSANPALVKREMEDYQGKVEAHFDETSEKFKQMASQYQDLYKHLSVGATTLCRPENISPGLVAGKDPLTALEKQTEQDNDKAKQNAETDSKIKADLEKLKADKVKQNVNSEASAKPDDKKDATPVAKSATNKKT